MSKSKKLKAHSANNHKQRKQRLTVNEQMTPEEAEMVNRDMAAQDAAADAYYKKRDQKELACLRKQKRIFTPGEFDICGLTLAENEMVERRVEAENAYIKQEDQKRQATTYLLSQIRALRGKIDNADWKQMDSAIVWLLTGHWRKYGPGPEFEPVGMEDILD